MKKLTSVLLASLSLQAQSMEPDEAPSLGLFGIPILRTDTSTNPREVRLQREAAVSGILSEFPGIAHDPPLIKSTDDFVWATNHLLHLGVISQCLYEETRGKDNLQFISESITQSILKQRIILRQIPFLLSAACSPFKTDFLVNRLNLLAEEIDCGLGCNLLTQSVRLMGKNKNKTSEAIAGSIWLKSKR